MKAHVASLLNAIVLIGLGSWGYFGSDNPSMTALIPVIIGAILIVLNGGVKKENKIIAHIAVVLTLAILIGLIKPFMGRMDAADYVGVARVSIMILFTMIAMIAFVRSFIDARKQRELEEGNN
ncbi:hypothetical protein [Kordia sp.]|uniref:hypothetical protein n=1 Tax=Kordia sp. TaxID=1965332 RepID=UPI0025BC1E58|nr:hypothetical protein [Kordia sp.]MCH2194537.1 hypothetical protein [Kordia sp.]